MLVKLRAENLHGVVRTRTCHSTRADRKLAMSLIRFTRLQKLGLWSLAFNPSEKAGKPNPTKKNQIEQVLFGSTIETILGMVIRII